MKTEFVGELELDSIVCSVRLSLADSTDLLYLRAYD